MVFPVSWCQQRVELNMKYKIDSVHDWNTVHTEEQVVFQVGHIAAGHCDITPFYNEL